MAETRANPGLTPVSHGGNKRRGLHPLMKKKIARGKRVRATSALRKKKR